MWAFEPLQSSQVLNYIQYIYKFINTYVCKGRYNSRKILGLQLTSTSVSLGTLINFYWYKCIHLKTLSKFLELYGRKRKVFKVMQKLHIIVV